MGRTSTRQTRCPALLPQHVLGLTDESTKGTTLGLIAFGGLVAGLVAQPVAGAFSDRTRPRWGRQGTIAIGVLLLLPCLALFGLSRGLVAVLASFALIQVAASIAQAA